MLLALSLTGVVAAAALVSVITAPPTTDPAVVADTTLTFEDLDGNGVDDDCQTEVVVADPVAAAAAEAAADLDGDGVISTSEAAQSNRVGGKNCNHGGYVSTVAHTDEACAPADETDTAVVTADEATADEAVTNEDAADENNETDETEPTTDQPCDEPAADAVEPTPDTAEDATVPTECVTPVTPAEAPAADVPADTSPNAHGKAVAKVAQDKTAIGGKNCNHGGAVSEAAKKDQAAKDAKKAEHNKSKESKTHGKKNGG